MAEKHDPKDSPGVLRAFLDRFLADRQQGKNLTLEEYQALFPGHETLILQEFELLSQTSAEGESEAGESVVLDGGAEGISSQDRVAKLAEHTPPKTRYQLRGEVARGGMGAVLKVWDEDLRRNLAMKVILGEGEDIPSGETPDVPPDVLVRFLEEAQITGQLDHPGIVPVHELGLDSHGRVYFTMRLVKGRDLKTIYQLVHAGKEGWNQTRALNVILRACEALAYAHSKGVIHRDLKPANVMVGKFGEVYVMDWGIAKVLGHEDSRDLRIKPEATTSLQTDRRDEASQTPDSPIVTMDGMVIGTPAYMPPEQAEGKVEEIGPHSDVYALGAMLYELLTGQMPYVPKGARMTPHGVVAALIQGPPKPIHELNPRVPAEMAAICEKAMSRQLADRYSSTQEMAEDLRAFLENRVVQAYRTGALVELKKWVQRNRALASSLVAAALLLVAGIIAFWIENNRARTSARRAEKSAAEAKASECLAGDKAKEAIDALKRANQLTYVHNIYGAWAAFSDGRLREARRQLDACPEEWRGWEWHHLHLRLHPEVAVYPGRHLVVESQGRWFSAVLGSDLRVFEVDGEHEGRSLGACENRMRPIRAMPDGKRLICGGPSELRVLDVSNGRILAQIPGVADLNWSLRVDVSSNGDVWAAVWESEEGGQLLIVDGNTHEVLHQFTTDHSYAVAVSPNGKTVVYHDGPPNFLVVRDVRSGRQLAKRRIHSGVYGMDYQLLQILPDNRRLVVNMTAGPVRILDLPSLETLVTLPGSDYPKAVSPDGKTIVTSFMNRKKLRAWDLRTGRPRFELLKHGGERGEKSTVNRIAFSPDGNRIATSGDKIIRVWDASSGEELTTLAGHQEMPVRCGFLKNGQVVSSDMGVWAGGEKAATVRVWDTLAGASWEFQGGITPHFGKTVPTDGPTVLLDRGRIICEFDLRTGERLRRLGWWGSCFAVSNDGKRLLLAGVHPLARHTLKRPALLLDVSTGQEIRRFEHDDDKPVTGLSFLGGGSVAIVRERDIEIWGTETVDPRILLRLDEGARYFGYSAQLHALLAGVGRDLCVWSLPDGILVKRIPHEGEVWGIALNPDGSRCAVTSDQQVSIWSTDDWRLEGRLEHRASGIAFSPDGLRLVCGGDGSLYFWLADTLELLAIVPLEDKRHTFMAFLGQTRILVGEDAGSGRVLDTNREAVARVLQSQDHLDSIRRTVGELFEQHLDPDAVRSAIDVSSELSDADRVRAHRLLRQTDRFLWYFDWWEFLQLDLPPHERQALLRKARFYAERWPDAEDGLILLGALEYRSGNYRGARMALERAVEVAHTYDTEANLYLAMANARLGRADTAQLLLRRGRADYDDEYDPGGHRFDETDEVRVLLGEAEGLVRFGETDPAILERDARRVVIRSTAGAEAYAEALGRARAAARQQSADRRLVITLGMAQYHAGELERALETFEHCEQLGETTPALLAFRALTHAALNEPGEAKAYAERFETAIRDIGQAAESAASLREEIRAALGR